MKQRRETVRSLSDVGGGDLRGDIKDTRGREKLRKLEEVIRNANYDFSREVIRRVQHIHSHDVNLLQLADLLVGSLAYHWRHLDSSAAKLTILSDIIENTGYSLNVNTLPSERKFNLCVWRPHE